MIPSTNQMINAFRNLVAAAPAHKAWVNKVCRWAGMEAS